MNNKKIEKIDKKIISFKEDVSINLLKDIDEIIIIVTDESFQTSINKYASKLRNERWSLNEIKQLITMKNPRYEFLHRDDNKNNPNLLGLTEQECLQLISELNNNDYNETLSNYFPNTNVYIKNNFYNKKTNKIINLYIKLSIIIKNRTRKVLIISFHPKGI